MVTTGVRVAYNGTYMWFDGLHDDNDCAGLNNLHGSDEAIVMMNNLHGSDEAIVMRPTHVTWHRNGRELKPPWRGVCSRLLTCFRILELSSQ